MEVMLLKIRNIVNSLVDVVTPRSDWSVRFRSSWYCMMGHSLTMMLWAILCDDGASIWILPVRIVLETPVMLAVSLYGVICIVIPLYTARKRRLLTSNQFFWRVLLCIGNASLTVLLYLCFVCTHRGDAWLYIGQLEVPVRLVMTVVYYAFVIGEIVLWIVRMCMEGKKDRFC